MKLFLSVLSLVTVFSNAAFADRIAPAQASRQIKEAVEAFRPLAESGVDTYKVAKNLNIHDALEELAAKESGDSAEEFEANWEGSSGEAWGGDSGAWGSETMSGAYRYITSVDKDYLEGLTRAQATRYRAKIATAKEKFSLLLHTGVLFGVGPLGAIQCGGRFASLLIYDPNSGKIYSVALEGSGC